MPEAFDVIEQIMADGRRWAVPDAFTIADAFLIVFYRWGGLVNVDMAQYASWTSLTALTMERASVLTAFRADGLPRLFA